VPTRVAAQDIEIRAAAETIEVPFGIRALQQGIQVEGVWISQPNTPRPPSPVSIAPRSRAPSIAPSIIRNNSYSSLANRPSFLNLNDVQVEQYPRNAVIKHQKSPSILITPNDRESFDLPFEYPNYENEARYPQTLTLEVPEGRERPYSKTTSDDSRRARRKSTSAVSFAQTSYSGREGSPSPPALTDGNSRSDTPNSDVRSNHTYLSQSNHRLSHVAETGQLGIRSRYPKQGDLVIPAYGDAFSYRSAFNFTPTMGKYSKPAISPSSPPALLTPTSNTYTWSPTESSTLVSPVTPSHNSAGNDWPLSSSSNWLPTTPITIPPLERPLRRPKSRSLSEVSAPRVYAPKPVNLKYPELNVDFLLKDPPNLDFNFVPPLPSMQLQPNGLMTAKASTSSKDESYQHTVSSNAAVPPTDHAHQTAVPLDTSKTVQRDRAFIDTTRHVYRRVNENLK
jgi:hypothetical protein